MNNYSLIQKFLHQLVLSSEFILRSIYEIEKILYKPSLKKNNSIFVTGLARAGTTVLMRNIYSSKEFASLTYDDMPFVLTSNLWNLFKKEEIKYQERSHGDGILVNQSSPEAFDEVFFRAFCSKDYIFQDKLIKHKLDNNILNEFIKFQNLIIHRYKKKRYLSKNNNLILRISSLCKELNSSEFIIIYRDPLAHSSSLLTQHKRFLNSDKFTKNYMKWLGHHEFGITHKPFELENEYSKLTDKMSINYWLCKWIEYYSHVLDLVRDGCKNIILVSYEELCKDKNVWKNLCNKINIQETESEFHSKNKNKNENIKSDIFYYTKALQIYDQLKNYSFANSRTR